MKYLKFIIFCCLIAMFAFMPQAVFSQDTAAQKIKLTWMYNYDLNSRQNKPKSNPKLEPLRKITYKCREKTFSDGYAVTFQGDSFHKKTSDDESIRVDFADGAYGDLNGDGKDDAVVFLESRFGGSGTWVTLAIVMNQDGKFKNTDCIALGDREEVNSVQIKHNKVISDLVLHLSGEPNCCPNSPVKFTFDISQAGRILNAQAFRNISHAGSELLQGKMFGLRKPDNEAIAHFNKAIRLYPQYEQGYLSRANALMSLGRFRQALRDYDSVLRRNPQHAEAYYRRAFCYLKLKQYDLAIKDINHTIEMEPENADAYDLRGSVYSHLLKYKEAIRDYSLSIEKFPKMKHEPCSQWQDRFEAAYLSRAGLYAQLKDYPNALAGLSKVISMAPPKDDEDYICTPEHEKYESMKGRAYLLRSRVYADTNNYKQAIKDISINIEPQQKMGFAVSR